MSRHSTTWCKIAHWALPYPKLSLLWVQIVLLIYDVKIIKLSLINFKLGHDGCGNFIAPNPLDELGQYGYLFIY